MHIEQIRLDDAKLTSQIDTWLASQLGATIYHTTDWNRIVQEVFGTRCRYFLAYEDERIVGVLPCHYVKQSALVTMCYSPPRIHEVSYGGPVAVDGQPFQISERLVEAAARSGFGVIVSVFNSPQNTDWAPSTGWRHVRRFESAYVDLTPSLDEIWMNSLNGKRRNMIRKAERTGVVVQDVGVENLDAYYGLVEQTYARAGLGLKPKSYYRSILETFGPRGQARLLLTLCEGEPLAGGVFLRYHTTAYYWVSATASNGRNLGQGELLQWEAIRWAKKGGCRWYDLVGVERDRLPHIARFKLGFSDRIVPYHHVSHAMPINRVVRRLEGILRLAHAGG